jgi:hypothetical protein
VTGSRDLTDRDLVIEAIADCVTGDPDHAVKAHTVVVGDCLTGADYFARDFWQQIIASFGNPETQENLTVHKADWAKHGKAAGPLRNQAMVDSGADVCLAFYKTGAGNRGTTDCVRRAKAAGIPVKEYTE